MIRYSLIFMALLMLSGCLNKTQSAAPVVSYAVGEGAGSTGMHTVLGGDTVYTVSKQYNLPIRDIITMNSMSAPYKLSVGYRIKLPPPNEYQVKKGDSLQSIAQIFDVSVSDLTQLNHIQSPYKVSQGQILRLPTPKPKEEYKEEQQTAFYQPPAYQTPNPAPSVTRQTLPAPNNTAVKPATPAPAKVQPASAAPPMKMPQTPARADTGKFMWPVDGNVISSYGPKDGGLHNDGINIKAAKGSPVRAAENGVVVYTGNKLEGYGNLILVRHQDKWMTAYAHLDKTLIKKGDVVKRGQSIGTVGSTGQVDSPQLHFEIRKGTNAINPKTYL